MLIKIVIAVAVLLAAFLGYVSTRPGEFHYERSGVIQAPASKIYPLISEFKKAQAWNPFDQKDPNLKRTLTGNDGQVGAVMTFEGNRDVGAGSLEILKLVPDQLVELKLRMTQPMQAENLVRYTLTPEGLGTRFTWAMEGNSGFIGKLISVFMNCEKFVAGDLEKGVAQLKALTESK